MEQKKKILLGEKDIMSKDNEDLFLNLNLNTTFSSIRNDKYENVFDVDAQFKKERNASRDFRIYGIVDATITDCDNLQMSIYSNSGVTGLSGFVKNISSTNLVYSGINVYGKKRGKFLIELSGYTNNFVYIKIPSNILNYKDQVYSQQLIFTDSDGKFIDYGNKTIDIDGNGNSVEINNDFYFLYNKHWIKKDLLIQEEKPAKVSLSGISSNGQISEIPSPILFPALFEGVLTNDNNATIIANNPNIVSSLYPITVYLDKPSPFGLESLQLKVESASIEIDSSVSSPIITPTDELILTDENFDIVFLPHNINFSVGEDKKSFYVFSPKDNLQEFVEDVTFGITNFNNVGTANTLTHKIEVIDSTDRNKVLLNFQDIYANRNYFYGQVYTNSIGEYSAGMPSVLRNGLVFSGTPMEFYPIDNFNIKVKNSGVDTILPINTKLGINEEQIFKAGQEITFNNIAQEYLNTEKHTIQLNFSTKRFATNQGNLFNSSNNGFTINGIPIINYNIPYKFDFDTIVAALKKEVGYYFASKVGGWDTYDLETPFNVVDIDAVNLSCKLVAKNPGTRLDIVPYGFSQSSQNPGSLLTSGDIFDPNSQLAIGTLTASTIQNFVLSGQIPFELMLGANFNNNLNAVYEIEFTKKGYDTMRFTTSSLAASLTGETYYLASGLNTILRNWDDSNNEAVYNHDSVVDTRINYPLFANNYNFGKYKIGDVYVNGALFLSKLYLDNTNNNSIYTVGGNSLNVSHAINSANNFSHDFLDTPIITIPETREYYSVFDVSQYGYLAILKPNFGTALSPPTGVSAKRSFDFRTGVTNSYSTFYTNDYYNYGGLMWLSSNSFYSSGGTIPTTNSPTTAKTLKTLLEVGQPSPLITPQGLQGVGASIPGAYFNEFTNLYMNSIFTNQQNAEGSNALSIIRLESQTPGVPYELKNFQELMYISGPNVGNKYTKNSIFYINVRPNQTAGSTINLANNYMGGFSLTRPSVPILPPILSVSFEFGYYTNSAGPITMKISLSNNSVNGNESVTINVLNNSTAISGTHYSEGQLMPTTLNWAVGERDKFINFTNINFSSGIGISFPTNLNLQIMNLVNVAYGTFPNTTYSIN